MPGHETHQALPPEDIGEVRYSTRLPQAGEVTLFAHRSAADTGVIAFQRLEAKGPGTYVLYKATITAKRGSDTILDRTMEVVFEHPHPTHPTLIDLPGTYTVELLESGIGIDDGSGHVIFSHEDTSRGIHILHHGIDGVEKTVKTTYKDQPTLRAKEIVAAAGVYARLVQHELQGDSKETRDSLDGSKRALVSASEVADKLHLVFDNPKKEEK